MNDHPSDKASYTFRVTVPEGLEVVSNGRLSSTTTRSGHTTWTWRAPAPMAPYLATLAIGEFELRSYRENGIRYWDAIDTDLYADATDDVPLSTGEIAEAALDRQPEITGFLEDVFGPYPFRSSGGIVDDQDIFFALETQTRVVYSHLFFTDLDAADWVVAHELAHQWVGNSIALEDWQHIWLNEGFATYAEWMWTEHDGGTSAQEMFDLIAGIPADDPLWSVVIGDPGPEALFDAAVYYRGAMTLHALRLEVGDDAFFTILRQWTRDHEGGNATIDQFMALAEQISGQQLDALFDLWLFTPGRPDTLGAPAPARSSSDITGIAQRLDP